MNKNWFSWDACEKLFKAIKVFERKANSPRFKTSSKTACYHIYLTDFKWDKYIVNLVVLFVNAAHISPEND